MTRNMPGGRLHFVLQRTSEEVHEPDAIPEAPLVRFAAYAPRHRLSGWVHLRADRLTDLLNAHDEVLLTDAEIESLESGQVQAVDEVLIDGRELIAVHASGPRGANALRQRTRTHPIVMQSGSYLIGGHLHASPGAEPLASFRARPRMIPLTDAWIEYWSGGQRSKHGIGTLIVNREALEWVRVVSSDELIDGELRLSPDSGSAADPSLPPSAGSA